MNCRVRHRTVERSSPIIAAIESLEPRLCLSIFTVTNINDSGPGSFREALTLANTSAEDDTIKFDTAGVFKNTQSIGLLSPLPTIDAAGAGLSIVGTGSARLSIYRASTATTNFRIFDSNNQSLTLSGITVQGNPIDNGGSIRVNGAGAYLQLADVVSYNSSAGQNGGTIYVANGGFVAMRNCRIDQSTAADAGGGIYFANGGSLLIEDSRFFADYANGAALGGGAIAFVGQASANPPPGFIPGALLIRNTDFFANTSAASGGAIVASNFTGTLLLQNSTFHHHNTHISGAVALTSGSGSIVIQNSTFTDNSAGGNSGGNGGGAVARTSTTSGNITVVSSVIAANGNLNYTSPDIFASAATTTTANFSAIGSPDGFTLSANSGNNLPFGTDLMLNLESSEGPTSFFLPKPGSPLIDAGANPAGLTTDQRGIHFDRVWGPAADIGAVEVQPEIGGVANAPDITTPGGANYIFSITYIDNHGVDPASVIGNNNAIRVTSPFGVYYPATFVSIDDGADPRNRTVTYSIPAPGGTWDRFDSGRYNIEVLANQVRDVDGKVLATGIIGNFVADLQPPFMVTNLNDSGPGSFRQAISDINANNVQIVEKVMFAPGLTGTITLTSGLVSLLDSAQIIGPGADQITISGNNASRILSMSSGNGPTVSISGLSFKNASDPNGSSAIFATGSIANFTITNCVFADNNTSAVHQSGGTLTVIDSLFANNRSNSFGAALAFTNGLTQLTVQRSIITGNSALKGGGIYSDGFVIIENSTISENHATTGGGGGIYMTAPNSSGPVVTIRNSTIANNTAATRGGGLHLDNYGGGLQILNSTISGNSAASSGGGIYRSSTVAVNLDVTSSIVSGNTAPAAPDIFSDRFLRLTFSAIGSAGGFSLDPNNSHNNLPFGANLNLGPLQNNGGPTETMLPGSGSPLINAFANALAPAGVPTDQRGFGFSRISGPAIDIGAVEVDSILPAVQSSAFNFITGSQSIRYTFSEPVTLDKSALELHNVSNSTIIPLNKIALTYDSSTNTATFTFPGYPNGVLPDGDYRAFLLKSGVQDSSHNHPAIDHMTIFDFLQGDLNHDRNVSIADFITLASNFGKTGVTYPDGDLNYDGIVSISDFLDLASKFNTSLPPPPPAAAPAADLSIIGDSMVSAQRQTRRHRLRGHHHPRPKAAEVMIRSRFLRV